MFDLLGASHQIMHVSVLVAALIHYRGLASAFAQVRGPYDIC